MSYPPPSSTALFFQARLAKAEAAMRLLLWEENERDRGEELAMALFFYGGRS